MSRCSFGDPYVEQPHAATLHCLDMCSSFGTPSHEEIQHIPPGFLKGGSSALASGDITRNNACRIITRLYQMIDNIQLYNNNIIYIYISYHERLKARGLSPQSDAGSCPKVFDSGELPFAGNCVARLFPVVCNMGYPIISNNHEE